MIGLKKLHNAHLSNENLSVQKKRQDGSHKNSPGYLTMVSQQPDVSTQQNMYCFYSCPYTTMHCTQDNMKCKEKKSTILSDKLTDVSYPNLPTNLQTKLSRAVSPMPSPHSNVAILRSLYILTAKTNPITVRQHFIILGKIKTKSVCETLWPPVGLLGQGHNDQCFMSSERARLNEYAYIIWKEPCTVLITDKVSDSWTDLKWGPISTVYIYHIPNRPTFPQPFYLKT